MGKKIMIPFYINRCFFILTFVKYVNVHKTNEREMLANEISMRINKIYYDRLSAEPKQPHKPKQSILMCADSLSLCVRMILILSIKAT